MLEPVTQLRILEASGARARRGGTAAAPDGLPDLLLIERARAREERAIEALIRRYSRRMFRVACSVLLDEDAAESAVQDAHLAAFGDLNRYAPDGKFSCWLTRLAFNQARRVRAAPGFLELTPERLDGIVRRVLAQLPHGSMLTISASTP